MHFDETKKSKCPFCRQVLGFEKEDYYKIMLARELASKWDVKIDHLRLEFIKKTKMLRSLNGWIRKMKRLKHQLE
jgi:hypothetical protein